MGTHIASVSNRPTRGEEPITVGNQEETKSFASRARDSDGLDSVSQVSVTTPKSQSGAGGSSRHGDSVSYVSHRTTTTTVSTKQKLEELEKQL